MIEQIHPEPTPEEAAAIVAAIESARGEASPVQPQPGRSRWEIAGRLGQPLPKEMDLEGALWPLANRGRSL